MVAYGAAYLTQAIFFGLLAQSTLLLVGGLMLLFMRISSGVIIPLDTYLSKRAASRACAGGCWRCNESPTAGRCRRHTC